MRIAIVGAGYVGLVSGACFADFGHTITCVDKDAGKIDALRRGEIPIFEPGLGHLVTSNAAAGRLTFATDLRNPVRQINCCLSGGIAGADQCHLLPGAELRFQRRCPVVHRRTLE